MTHKDFDETVAQDLDAVDAYDYELPEELVAAHPAERRAGSRLLVGSRQTRSLEHSEFSRLPEFLRPGDLLVFNDTRVIPARILTHKQTGGAVELLVLDVDTPAGAARFTEAAGGRLVFRCMTRSSRPLRANMELSVDGADVPAVVVRQWESGQAVVEVDWEGTALQFLESAGHMPLPPYILKRREHLGEPAAARPRDQRRYQTIYASRPGAVAAPTAGLHFSDGLFSQLDQMGVERAFVTLQVGAGTFRPMSSERLSEHTMHAEEYEVSEDLAEALAGAEERGGRVIAVGTTSARALEAEARRATPFEPGVRRTDIFLHPGVDFSVCDGLITNFHLPRSTLLALVAGFAGYEFMRQIYAEAVEDRYRFYSYGDAMLLV
jgi:S-adenosylmethionine:tRNA ribosyltransferase-isomerase